MKYNKKLLLLLFLLNSCVETTAFLGPAVTAGSTGNIYQAGLNYGMNKTVLATTGKYPIEHLTNVLNKTKETVELAGIKTPSFRGVIVIIPYSSFMRWNSLISANSAFILINFIIFPVFFYFIVYINKKSKVTYRKKPYKKNLFIFGLLFGFGFYLSGVSWITKSLTFDQNFKILIPAGLHFSTFPSSFMVITPLVILFSIFSL